jgi:hypothetical protein
VLVCIEWRFVIIAAKYIVHVHATELTDYIFNTYSNRSSPFPLLAGAVTGSIQTKKQKKVPSRWVGKLYCQTRPFILPVATFYKRNDELISPLSSICLAL